MSQLIKNFDKITSIIEKMSYCTEKQEIEKVFEKYEISDLNERIELLQKTMQVEEQFFSNKHEISLKEKYDHELEIFVEGSWRFLVEIRP